MFLPSLLLSRRDALLATLATPLPITVDAADDRTYGYLSLPNGLRCLLVSGGARYRGSSRSRGGGVLPSGAGSKLPERHPELGKRRAVQWPLGKARRDRGPHCGVGVIPGGRRGEPAGASHVRHDAVVGSDERAVPHVRDGAVGEQLPRRDPKGPDVALLRVAAGTDTSARQRK